MQVLVQNRGKTIPKEKLDRIFERFFRLDESRSSNTGGAGLMKHNAILTNAGHFDCEVDVAGLAAMAVKREVRRDNIEGFTLPDGRVLNVIGEGRLVNLAAGNGHPAEIMDMSFSVQALALEWLVKHRDGLEKKRRPGQR